MGSVNGKVFSVVGPNNYQINSLGIFSGNDAVGLLHGFRFLMLVWLEAAWKHLKAYNELDWGQLGLFTAHRKN